MLCLQSLGLLFSGGLKKFVRFSDHTYVVVFSLLPA